MKLNYFKCLLFTFIFTACVDPIDVETSEAIRILTFEGYISTQPGPHNIRLSYTAKYGSIFQDFPQRIKGAKIAIRDSEGLETLLIEQEDGNYQTPKGFRAEEDNFYSVLIETPKGRRYVSFPEYANNRPKIDSLFYQYQEYPTGNSNQLRSGFSVFSQVKDEKGKDNFYVFVNSGIYEINARPDLYQERDSTGQVVIVPKDCCVKCLIKEEQSQLVDIESDRLFDGEVLSKEIIFLEDDGLRFSAGAYSLTTNVISVTKEAFQYLKLLNEQLSISGDIFDPPPAQIQGNIVSLSDDSEETIGYFWVASVSSDSISLNPSKLSTRKPEVQIQDDCRAIDGSLGIIPEWW